MKRHENTLDFSRLRTATLVALFCFGATSVHSGEQVQRPNVRVSMYLADEQDACRPDGYESLGNETQDSCKELTLDDIDTLVRRDRAVVTVQHNIPPENLSLGNDLKRRLDAYTAQCSLLKPCHIPSDRRAIILTFTVDVAQPEQYQISMRRIPPDNFPHLEHSSSGALSEKGRWINHQRADIFLPSYGVRWLLEIGLWSWDLGTVP